MNTEGQYLVLISNTEVRGNTQAKFSTHLAHKLRLGPKCMVSLVEASIPASWLTIAKDAKIHLRKTDGSSHTVSISPGYYRDAVGIVDAINISCLAYGVVMSYDPLRNKVGVFRTTDVVESVYFDFKTIKC
jgi:hypothetical protein